MSSRVKRRYRLTWLDRLENHTGPRILKPFLVVSGTRTQMLARMLRFTTSRARHSWLVETPPNAYALIGPGRGPTRWYSRVINRFWTAGQESLNESLWKYDLVSGQSTQLELIGLKGDFATHGLDVYSLPDDKTKIFLYAVNHARDGDSILVFSHVKVAGWADCVCGSFFFTNDHYHTSGPLRFLEEKYGPWYWATEVQYCDASGTTVQCKQAAGPFPGANGIAIWEDRLFVADSHVAKAYIFNVTENNHLIPIRTVFQGPRRHRRQHSCHSTTGDPIIAVIPNGVDIPRVNANVHRLGRDFLVPAAAVRIDVNKDYEPHLFYKDEGTKLSFMTTLAVDPYRGVAVGGSVLQYGGFMCCTELEKFCCSRAKHTKGCSCPMDEYQRTPAEAHPAKKGEIFEKREESSPGLDVRT
ncbi:hypothetical protein K469DRAFT_693427 [Zopfia rhizophila CBS 207.26]|uniref:Calcium-dependent phosphotriesterase n=1 Tax=Zopfia rhizophila CBS 207.26 TaxID=1314779 RepID=A0A6A6DPH3_9PEZI|nr:hypothetical protein K469DRAFT_693427 [Zopfia rhizophila CBS 207.26]